MIRWNPVERVRETSSRGHGVLHFTPRLNKGTAFTDSERAALGLTGPAIPSRVLTLDQQAERAYRQCSQQPSALGKNIYLTALHDRNEVLFYRVLTDHLSKLLPIFLRLRSARPSGRRHQYRRPRGVYNRSINAPGQIETALRDSKYLPARWTSSSPPTPSHPRHRRLGRRGHRYRGRQARRLYRYGRHRPHPDLPVVLDVGTDRAA